MASPSPLQKGRGQGRGVQFCAATKMCYHACDPVRPDSWPICGREAFDQTASSPRPSPPKGGEGEAAAAAFAAPGLNSMTVRPGQRVHF